MHKTASDVLFMWWHHQHCFYVYLCRTDWLAVPSSVTMSVVTCSPLHRTWTEHGNMLKAAWWSVQTRTLVAYLKWLIDSGNLCAPNGDNSWKQFIYNYISITDIWMFLFKIFFSLRQGWVASLVPALSSWVLSPHAVSRLGCFAVSAWGQEVLTVHC